jgi:hypothetical protein
MMVPHETILSEAKDRVRLATTTDAIVRETHPVLRRSAPQDMVFS